MSIDETLSDQFVDEENDADDEIGLFHCTVCNTSFPRFKIFLAHVDSHSGEEPLPPNLTIVNDEIRKPLTTEQCSSPDNKTMKSIAIEESTISTNASLTWSMPSYHLHNEATPTVIAAVNSPKVSTTAECGHCRRLFVNERALKIHINKSHGSDVKAAVTATSAAMVTGSNTTSPSSTFNALNSSNSASFAAAALSTLNGLINAAGAQLIVTSLTSNPGITTTSNSLIITPSNAIYPSTRTPMNSVSLLNASNFSTLNLVSSSTTPAGTNALSFSPVTNVSHGKSSSCTTTTPANSSPVSSFSVACDECGRKFPTSKQTKVHKFKSHIEPRRKRELFLKQHKLDPGKADVDLNINADVDESLLKQLSNGESPQQKMHKNISEIMSKMESGTIYCQKCDRPFLSDKALSVHMLKAHTSASATSPAPTCSTPNSSQPPSTVTNQSQTVHNSVTILPPILPRLATKPGASLIQNNAAQNGQSVHNSTCVHNANANANSNSDSSSGSINFKIRRAPGSGHLECNGCGRSFTRMNNLYRHKKLYCTTFQMRNRTSTTHNATSSASRAGKSSSMTAHKRNSSQPMSDSTSNTTASNVLTASAVNAVNALVATLQLQQAGISPLTLIANRDLQNDASVNTSSVKALLDGDSNDNKDQDDSKDDSSSEHPMTTTKNGYKVYQCSLCPKTFNLVAVLRRHLMVHKRGKAFSCEKCGAAFTRKYNLRLHRDFRCKLRGTMGLSTNLLSSYLSSSEAASDNDQNDSKDLLTISANDMNETSSCISHQSSTNVHSNKNTLIGSSLTSSLQTTSGVVPSHNKRYSCSKCQVGFNHASNLYTHIKRYCRLRDLPGSAQSSNQSAENNKKMTILAASITPQYQKQLTCETTVATPSTTDNTTNLVVAETTGRITKESLPPNTCYLCHRQFDSARGLTRHRRRIHKISARGGSRALLLQSVTNRNASSSATVLTDPPSDCSEIACDTCHKWFTSPRALAVHRVRKHNVAPVSHIKRVRCEFCRKRFRNPLTLQMHRKMHIDGLLDNCGNNTQASTMQSSNNSPDKTTVTALAKPNGGCSVMTPVMIVSPNSAVSSPEEVDKMIPNSTVSEVTFANFLKEQREQILGKEFANCEEEEGSLASTNLSPLKNIDEHLQLDTSLRSSDGQYECRVCSRLFVNRLSLTGHLKSHYKESSKPYSCGSCVRRFTSLNNLRYHRSKFCPVLMQQQGDKIEEESKIIKSEGVELANDYKLQSAGNTDAEHSLTMLRSTLNCLHCNKRFADNKSLEVHAMREHSTADYGLIKCIQCSRTFASYSAFRLHMTRAHSAILIAAIDGKENSTLTSEDLLSGSQTGKSKLSPSIISTDQAGQLKMKFINQNLVKLEPKQEATNETEIASKLGNKNANFTGMPFVCTKCGRSFQTVYGLGAHMRFCRDRVVNKSKTRCQVCQRVFITEYALQVHNKICKQEIPTAANNAANATKDQASKSCCKNCGRKFGTTRALGAHSRFCKPYQGKTNTTPTATATSEQPVVVDTASSLLLQEIGAPVTLIVENDEEKHDESTSESNATETMEHPDGVEEMEHDEVLLEKKLTGEDIEKHQLKTTPKDNQCNACPETSRDEVEHHKCDICDQSFSSALTLGSHLRTHKESDDQTLICSNCNKSFPSRSKLFYHQNWFCSAPTNNPLPSVEIKQNSIDSEEIVIEEDKSNQLLHNSESEPPRKKARNASSECDETNKLDGTDDEEKPLTIDIEIGDNNFVNSSANTISVSEACI